MYLIIGETWRFLFEIHDQKYLLEKKNKAFSGFRRIKMNKSSLFRKTKLNDEKKFSNQDLIITKLSR
jgi:hypothetical protein